MPSNSPIFIIVLPPFFSPSPLHTLLWTAWYGLGDVRVEATLQSSVFLGLMQWLMWGTSRLFTQILLKVCMKLKESSTNRYSGKFKGPYLNCDVNQLKKPYSSLPVFLFNPIFFSINRIWILLSSVSGSIPFLKETKSQGWQTLLLFRRCPC